MNGFTLTLTPALSPGERETFPRFGKVVAFWFMGSMRESLLGKSHTCLSRWERESLLDAGLKLVNRGAEVRS